MMSPTTDFSKIEIPAVAAASASSVADLEALREHMCHCNSSRGPWFSARCFAESFDDFAGNRFVTTLSIATLMIAAAVMTL